jgi:hypothetical protein
MRFDPLPGLNGPIPDYSAVRKRLGLDRPRKPVQCARKPLPAPSLRSEATLPPAPPPPRPKPTITAADKIGSRVRASAVLRVVAEAHGLTLNDVLSPRRDVKTVHCRQHAWDALVFYRWDLSLPEIGRRTGRDHSTVVHGLQRFRKQLRPLLAREIAIVDEALREFAAPDISEVKRAPM